MKSGPALLGILTALTLAGPAVADCGPRSSSLAVMLHGGDLDGAQRLVEEIEHARECSPGERRSARRALSETLLAQAKLLRADPGKVEAAAQFIRQAADLRASWIALKELGDLDAARHDYPAAAQNYQDAIELLAADEDDQSIARIPKATITQLVERAAETRHLAASGERGTLVSAIPGRDGKMGGFYSSAIDRGPMAIRVPAPILFQFKSDLFTTIGKAAADELEKLLKERAPSYIVVTGHTDRIGGDAFNLELSRKRATAVVAYLRTAGVGGTIIAVGKGRSVPRVLSEPNDYTQAQIDQLNRRVEFDWKP